MNALNDSSCLDYGTKIRQTIGVFTVRCLDKKRVGRSGFYFILFYFIFQPEQLISTF